MSDQGQPELSEEIQRAKLRLEEQAAAEAEREARFSRRYKLVELKERREDRAVRRLELAASSGKGIRFTSAQATVAAAALAVLSAVAGGLIQAAMTKDVETSRNDAQLEMERLRAQATIDLEQQKQDAADRIAQNDFETTLILRAIEAPSRETQIRNLKFFLNAGFISDAEGKIANMDEADFPSLPVAEQKRVFSIAELASEFRPSVGVITVKSIRDDGMEMLNTGTLFVISDTGYALTVGHLFDESAVTEFELEVSLSDQTSPKLPAELISIDRNLDTAVVKLPTGSTRYAPVNLSPAAPSIGERLVAIGFSKASGFSVQSSTVISFDGPKGTWLVDPQGSIGQAGAPLFSDRGEVIAVTIGMQFDQLGVATATVVRPVGTTMNLVSAFASGTK